VENFLQLLSFFPFVPLAFTNSLSFRDDIVPVFFMIKLIVIFFFLSFTD